MTLILAGFSVTKMAQVIIKAKKFLIAIFLLSLNYL